MTPTPGQIAYEAYARVQATAGDWRRPTPFASLQALTRQGWDAAAQAVLEAFVSSARPLDTAQEETQP